MPTVAKSPGIGAAISPPMLSWTLPTPGCCASLANPAPDLAAADADIPEVDLSCYDVLIEEAS